MIFVREDFVVRRQRPDASENGFFVASNGVLYVIDDTTHGLMKVTF